MEADIELVPKHPAFARSAVALIEPYDAPARVCRLRRPPRGERQVPRRRARIARPLRPSGRRRSWPPPGSESSEVRDEPPTRCLSRNGSGKVAGNGIISGNLVCHGMAEICKTELW